MILTNKKSLIGLAACSCLAFVSADITGCGTSNSASNQAMKINMNTSNSQQPMETVKMTIPKEALVGKMNRLSVLVTQQGQPLNQVDDVMFEIWKNVPNSKHEIVHANRTGDGIYSIKYTFKDAGMFNVMYHVVAGGNMIMTGPQKIVVTK